MASTSHHGFILVTADPLVAGGEIGTAWDLVRARLDSKSWPLYERTRHRKAIDKSAPLAFYIAGKRENHGRIVATAAVKEVEHLRYSSKLTDPPEFLTDRPESILHLDQVRYLEHPIDLRARVTDLDVCPKNARNWGSILQGGVTALSAADWKRLFR